MMAVISLAIGIGSMFLQRLMQPEQKNQFGPRLSDVNVPSVSPGNPISRLWGTMKMAGQCIWVSRLIETVHAEQAPGAKGGGDGPTTFTFTYSVDAAIAICRGPVFQINRIWANQKLLWVNPLLEDQAQQTFDNAYYAEFTRLVEDEYVVDYTRAYCSAFFFAFNNYRMDEYTYSTQPEALAYILSHPVAGYPAPNSADVNALLGQMLDGLGHDMQYASYKIRFDQLNIYMGDDTQTPDPKIESWIGVGNVPAFRGICYFVINNLQLEDFGNALPTFNIEVQEREGTESVSLHEVIADICTSANLAPTEYDTASFMNLNIRMDGFALTQATTGRDAINSLQKVYPFDAAETNYKLLFSWINQYPKLILRRDDLGAHVDSDETPASEEVKRMSDLDLPYRINLKFQERARNFSTNMLHVMRSLTDSKAVDDRDVTIALTRSEAKKWLEEQLAVAFTVRRTHTLLLPRKYIIIEPGDVILMPVKGDTGVQYGLRCIEANIGNNGIIEIVFIDHFYHQEMVAAEAETDNPGAYDGAPTNMPLGSSTVAYLLDCPLLTDVESDNVGFYAVLGGTRVGWAGGVLMVDMGVGTESGAYGKTVTTDPSGSNWVTAAQIGTQAPHGYALNRLDDRCRPMMWDRVSEVTVYLRNRDITLVSASEVDMLTQPVNLCMIGNEVVQFADAHDLGNGNWRLTNFLRGLRGTEAAIKTHQIGERFVRLKQASTSRIEHDQRYLNQTSTFRALTVGDSTADAATFGFQNTGNSLRPRAPDFRTCYRDDAHDVTLNWLPRVRQNGNLVSGQPVPLDQAVEAYEIDVIDSGTVRRTYQLGAVRTWNYTAAQQATDLGSTPSAITFRLYQLGAIIGRGYVSEITV